MLTVSMDLPFAQKRWCGAAGADKVKTLSDYQDRSFASAYGVLIKELKLLSRSLFVIDKNDVVRYVQHVDEVAKEPDYDAVLRAVKPCCRAGQPVRAAGPVRDPTPPEEPQGARSRRFPRGPSPGTGNR